ncbi:MULTISPECIES: hypothetical protein [unclassified Eikenella]|uniref:hypothetical protein n=1 Tax=unclassified Eikenella TaxID=2639367 RepID=UPI000AB9E634|nr:MULTISPECIES: hypothetical protein [unclassified Eikenella]
MQQSHQIRAIQAKLFIQAAPQAKPQAMEQPNNGITKWKRLPKSNTCSEANSWLAKKDNTD